MQRTAAVRNPFVLGGGDLEELFRAAQLERELGTMAGGALSGLGFPYAPGQTAAPAQQSATGNPFDTMAPAQAAAVTQGGLLSQDMPTMEVAAAPMAPFAAMQPGAAPRAAPTRPPAPMPTVEQPNAWDYLERLSTGYDAGGLLGGIAFAANTGRDAERAAAAQQQTNATAQFMADKLGDPALASMLAQDPQLMRAALPALLGPGESKLTVTEVYDAQGRAQKALFNPATGQLTPVGGAKAPAAGGATAGLRPPSGMMWADPNDPSKGVKQIPGAEKALPGDVVGKIAMMDDAAARIAESRKYFEQDWGMGESAQWLAANTIVGDIGMLSGNIGLAQRDIATGVEAALRTMTGAAAPEQEVKRYTQLFLPGPQDSPESAKQKIDGLLNFMSRAKVLIMQGRSPGGFGQMPLAAATGALDQIIAGQDPLAAAGGAPAPGAAPSAPAAPAAAAVAGAPDRETALRDAALAIQAGKDPVAVAERLAQWGYSIEELY